MKKYSPLLLVPVIVAVLLGGCAAAGAGGGAGDATDPLANIPEVNFAGFDTVSPTSLSTLISTTKYEPDAVDKYQEVNNLDNTIIVILTNTVANAIEDHVAAGGDPEQAFTFENIIERADGAVHKQFFTVRLEDDTNGYVFRGFNDQVYYAANDLDNRQAESSWENARIELYFGSGFDTARFVLMQPDRAGVEGLDYTYETRSGKRLANWVYGYDGEEQLWNSLYESIDNDGSLTYRFFQDDQTPTEVMKQNTDGIGYVHVSKADTPITTYALLDHDGADTGNELSTPLRDDLDSIVDTLVETDPSFVGNEVRSFLESADLEAASYDELLPVHEAYTPSWE